MSQETLALDSAIQCNAAMYGIFDGSTSYVEVADNDLLSFGANPFSLSMWVNLSNNSSELLLSKGDEYVFILVSGRPRLTLLDGDGYLSETGWITIPKNVWTFLTVTHDGSIIPSHVKHYRNGIIKASYESDNEDYVDMKNSALPIRIMRGVGNFQSLWGEGSAREVIIYDKELSQAEVTAIYGGSPLSTNIVAEYKLRGDCQDNSGNNLHGTNYNVTFPEEVPALALDSGVAIGGTSGPVLQFDGSDYYTAPALPNNGNDDFDINFNYYFLEDGISYQYIFHAYDSESGVEFRIRISTLNDLRVTLGDSSAIVYRLTDETTYLIRVIKVNNTITLYVDGDSKGSSIFSDEFTFDEYYLGGDLGVSAFPSNGSKLSTVSGAYQFSVAYTDILRTTEAEINDNIASIVNIGNAGGYFEQSEASERSILESLCAYRSLLALHSPVETQVSLGSTVQGNAGLYGIFNGTSSYVEVDDNDLFSFGDGSNDSPFSICAWVYINDNASFPLIAKYGGTVALREYALITGPDGEIQMILYDKSIPKYILAKSSTIFVENAWTHVAATYNGDGNSYADIGLYVNGSPIVTLDGDSGGYVAMENSSTSLWIGHYINTAFGNGKIRGVRIYNKELSAVEVLAEYNTGQVVDSDALIAEYKLRGDCQDSGPNDLHGTNNDVTFPEAVDPLALNSSLL